MGPPPLRRKLLLGAATAGVLAAGAVVWSRPALRAADAADAAFALPASVDAHQVALAFRVGGRIADIAVDEGSIVAPGTLLAQLDRKPFDDDLRLATAEVAEARARLARLTHGSGVGEIATARTTLAEREADAARARAAHEQLRGLLAQGMATRPQVDEAEGHVRQAQALVGTAHDRLNLLTRGANPDDIDAAKAAVATAEARQARAATAGGDTELRAPSLGVVALREREVGAFVAPGQTVLALSLVEPVWVRAWVPQHRLGRLVPGMAVRLKTDAPAGPAYDGVIGSIAPDAEPSPQANGEVRHRVRVIVRDPEHRLRQGMRMTVLVPESAAAAPGLPGS